MHRSRIQISLRKLSSEQPERTWRRLDGEISPPNVSDKSAGWKHCWLIYALAVMRRMWHGVENVSCAAPRHGVGIENQHSPSLCDRRSRDMGIRTRRKMRRRTRQSGG